jgi:hypothetical protein
MTLLQTMVVVMMSVFSGSQLSWAVDEVAACCDVYPVRV